MHGHAHICAWSLFLNSDAVKWTQVAIWLVDAICKLVKIVYITTKNGVLVYWACLRKGQYVTSCHSLENLGSAIYSLCVSFNFVMAAMPILTANYYGWALH